MLPRMIHYASVPRLDKERPRSVAQIHCRLTHPLAAFFAAAQLCFHWWLWPVYTDRAVNSNLRKYCLLDTLGLIYRDCQVGI